MDRLFSRESNVSMIWLQEKQRGGFRWHCWKPPFNYLMQKISFIDHSIFCISYHFHKDIIHYALFFCGSIFENVGFFG